MGWHAYAKLRHALDGTLKIGAGQQPTRASNAPGRRSALFGLAGGGVYPADAVTDAAVRSYRTFSTLPSSAEASDGGMFSVVLSRPDKSGGGR